KKVKDSDDHEAIKKAADELTNEAQKVGAKLYSAQAQNPSDDKNQNEQNNNPDSGTGPVDAEFKEKE
ncbi:TPA: molecular chaperone DnaK, partial [Candidatus Uhrbacteria bacterium]|nr:molecular chaperone DnaK [Candidatus Uhrbacteria bacterium]